MTIATRIGMYCLAVACLALSPVLLQAQTGIKMPRISQYATVSQTIGLTEISLTYHRPGVKGRVIWGGLVPYDRVWRAGANDNTTISFSGPVNIDGQVLPAGTYGFHAIPTEGEWTLIFSKNYTSWGSFTYRESEDALRIKVTPESAPFEEWLSYRFDNPSNDAVDVALYWEKLRIAFRVDVDVASLVVENARKELRHLTGFINWRSWYSAANYCLNHDIYLDEAATWADRAIAMERNFSTLHLKSRLQEKGGHAQDAEETMAEAMEIAGEIDINNLGYFYLGQQQVDKAIGLFKQNVEKYPESWNVYDSLAEAYSIKGDKERSIENYKTALSMVKDEQQKNRITQVLQKLQAN